MRNRILLFVLILFAFYSCKKDEVNDETHFIQVLAKYETNASSVKGNILLFDINSISELKSYSVIHTNSSQYGELFALDIGGGTETAIFPKFSKKFNGAMSIYSKSDFLESFPHKYFIVIYVNDFGYQRASGKIINYDGTNIKLEKIFTDPLSKIPVLFPTQYEQW